METIIRKAIFYTSAMLFGAVLTMLFYTATVKPDTSTEKKAISVQTENGVKYYTYLPAEN